MKNKITAAALLFLVSFATSCEPGSSEEIKKEPLEEEIIVIPDEIFKNALVNTKSVDTNNDGVGDVDVDTNDDGEIQRSEAEGISSLVLSFDYQTLERFVDLSGIENFTGLTHLRSTGESFYAFLKDEEVKRLTYDFRKLEKLELLQMNRLGSEYIEHINLTGLKNLTIVDLSHNRPTYFEGFNSPLNFIKLTMEGCVNLKDLAYLNSFLHVDFCQVTSLEKLYIPYLEGGEPEVFDFRCLTNLKWLDISENLIDSLLLKNSSVLDTFIAKDIGSSDGHIYPPLNFICIDDLPGEFEQIAPLMDENTVVNTNCAF